MNDSFRKKESTPEYWQALLDSKDVFKQAHEATKNRTWCINGNTAIIIGNLKKVKIRLETVERGLGDEHFKNVYRDTIQRVGEFIETLEEMEIREVRISQIQLTTHYKLKKGS